MVISRLRWVSIRQSSSQDVRAVEIILFFQIAADFIHTIIFLLEISVLTIRVMWYQVFPGFSVWDATE
jgi:hypothetical protein